MIVQLLAFGCWVLGIGLLAIGIYLQIMDQLNSEQKMSNNLVRANGELKANG